MKRAIVSAPVAIAAAGLLLMLLSLAAQAQATVPITPDQSVGVLSEDPGTGTRYSTTILPFGNYTGTTSGDPVFGRTYLHFPLDAVPAGSTVDSAVLFVYVDDRWPDDRGAPMSLYPVLSATWPPIGPDWDDMSNWPALGGSVDTTDVTSATDWFTWDVTPLAQGWAEGTIPNYGLAVAAAELTSTVSNWATARRLTADDPDTRPYLQITFTEPTPTPTATTAPEPPAPPPPRDDEDDDDEEPPPPTATPIPTPLPTPTPEPVLLPQTGTKEPGPAGWTVLLGCALAMLVGLMAGRR